MSLPVWLRLAVDAKSLQEWRISRVVVFPWGSDSIFCYRLHSRPFHRGEEEKELGMCSLRCLCLGVLTILYKTYLNSSPEIDSQVFE